MLTKHPIVVHYGWLHTALELPAGTRLTRATNIPQSGCYWVKNLPRSLRAKLGSKEFLDATCWCRVYGFLIRPNQLVYPLPVRRHSVIT